MPAPADPSFAYASALPGDFSAWLDARASKEAQEEDAQEARAARSERRRSFTAAPPEAKEIDRALAAFRAERRARAEALGAPDPYASPAAQEFLVQLDARRRRSSCTRCRTATASSPCSARCPSAERLSGLFIGHDGDPEIARSSPGEIMVHTVVADAIARGFATFDLGVGEARYKDEACEIVEPLFNSAFAVTLKGRLAAWAFLAARRAKRGAKRSPRFRAMLARLRRLRGRSGE